MHSWTRAYGERPIRADLRMSPADFQVTERAAFDFSDDGEHDWLWIEKTSANTVWVARQLARFAAVADGDVGYAGMKDRHAITRQWFSVRRAAGHSPDWTRLALPEVQVLRHVRHRKKLRRGAHTGNEFKIYLRNIKYLEGDLESRLYIIQSSGVPNYFGEQRFGRNGSNLAVARQVFAGKRLKRQARSLALSAARSWLFNHVLASRVADGSWNCLLPGDCASLDGSNSVFRVTGLDDELRARCSGMDLHPSGPLWGSGDAMTGGRVAALEQSVAQQHPALAAGLERVSKQARRALRLPVRDLEWRIGADCLQLCFNLPGGAYATAVLRELADYADRSSRAAAT